MVRVVDPGRHIMHDIVVVSGERAGSNLKFPRDGTARPPINIIGGATPGRSYGFKMDPPTPSHMLRLQN